MKKSEKELLVVLVDLSRKLHEEAKEKGITEGNLAQLESMIVESFGLTEKEVSPLLGYFRFLHAGGSDSTTVE
jgi:hypothetical protein